MFQLFGQRVRLGHLVCPIIKQRDLKKIIMDSNETFAGNMVSVALMTVTGLTCDTSDRMNIVTPVVSHLAAECGTVL